VDLHELLEKVVNALEEISIPYLVTGSVASMMYGEPRFTNDIDIVVRMSKGHIPRILKAFPSPEYYVAEYAVEQAVAEKDMFNIIHPESGLKLDFIVSKETEYSHIRFERARTIHPAKGWTATFASPEDVIIKKMEFYHLGGSDKHLRDIAGILRVSGQEIDHAYVERWALKLGLTAIWEAVLENVARNP
jgi:hypothetical protein